MTAFRLGETIRYIKTGKPYLIVFVSDTAVLVVDLQAKDDIAIPLIILPRSFDQWEEDWKMDRTNIRYNLDREDQFNFRQSTL